MANTKGKAKQPVEDSLIFSNIIYLGERKDIFLYRDIHELCIYNFFFFFGDQICY